MVDTKTTQTGRGLEILVIARQHADPATGRLRPEECAALFLQIGVSLKMSWAAVALRIPATMRPTAEECAAYRRRRGSVRAVCPACADPECGDCRKLAEEFGPFDEVDLIEMIAIATAMGGLSYAEIQREQRRRILREEA